LNNPHSLKSHLAKKHPRLVKKVFEFSIKSNYLARDGTEC